MKHRVAMISYLKLHTSHSVNINTAYCISMLTQDRQFVLWALLKSSFSVAELVPPAYVFLNAMIDRGDNGRINRWKYIAAWQVYSN